MKHFLALLLCLSSCGGNGSFSSEKIKSGDVLKGSAMAVPESLKEIQKDLYVPENANLEDGTYKSVVSLADSFSLLSVPEKIVGMERLEYGETACVEAAYYNPQYKQTFSMPAPMAWPSRTVPRVGRQYRCQFAASAMQSPDWPMVMLWSDRPPIALPLANYGLPGCTLFVDLLTMNLMFPGSDPTNLLYYSDKTRMMEFCWTPTSEWLGKTLTLQGLVFTPPNATKAGLLVTQAIRLDIGSW